MSVDLTPAGTRGVNMPGGPAKKFFVWLMVTSHRLGVGRQMDGKPVVLLTTRGAQSGQLRTAPVMCFEQDEGRWLVVASAAGAVRHPAWYVNMARNPNDVWVEVHGQKRKVAPTSLRGAQRDEAWRSIIAAAPRFSGYQEKTDREIPVVLLTATS